MRTRSLCTITRDALPHGGSYDGAGLLALADAVSAVRLPAAVREELLRLGDGALAEEIPALRLSDYTEFSRNGNRVHFEERYFSRRTQLTRLVLAQCVEESGRFLDRIGDLLWAILEETSWCLPAHNTYVRDTAPLAVPDPARPVIDLFAAETAQLLGLTELLLGTKLADLCARTSFELAAVSKRVEDEIRHRILVPYLTDHFWWMGDGIQPLCNWTPWITQNILIALYSRRDGFLTAEEARRAAEQAALSVDDYLTDYGADGCCNEGAFYYGHSGLCLSGCYDVLDRITDGGMRTVWQQPLIRNIASYIVRMYVGDGRYFNYSDASPYAGARSARDYLFARRTGNGAYAAFAAADFRAQPVTDRLMSGERNLYYHLLQFSLWEEMEQYQTESRQPEDAWFESTGLMTARDAHWALAAKAGHNGDSHNHNDIGSVTLYLDKRPFLIDLGVETYTAKTFSGRRYEIWTMQSAYHNTVNFVTGDARGGPEILQRDGSEYAAEEVRCILGEEKPSLSMEMARAYADPRVKSCRRTVCLEKGTEEAPGRVCVTDHVTCEPGTRGILTYMTCEEPVILRQETGDVTIGVGALGTLRVTGAAGAEIGVCPVTDPRLKEAWPHDCYRILLPLAGEEAVTLILAGGGSGT